MRIWILVLAAGLQLAVLGFMAGEREWILRNGQTIFLRTAPMDPQDPFRGNYVRLDYDISRIQTNRMKGGLARELEPRKRGMQVYAVLTNKCGLVYSLDYATDQRPSGRLFLRGRVDQYWGGNSIPVRYGLEAFFMQEDKAKQLEGQRRRGEIQVPLEVEVAVSGKGVSVLKGYRWCDVGIGLNIETVSRTNRQVTAVTVKLMNVSSNSIAVVDLPGGRSFFLVNDEMRSWGDRGWTWVDQGKPRPRVTDSDVVVLKPGDSHSIRVDMTRPEWFVRDVTGFTSSLSSMPWRGSMFRLVYNPPSPSECQNLKYAKLIWQGELPSRAFGGGGVD